MFGTKEEIMVKNALDILESVGILKIWASSLQLPSHVLLRGVDAVEKEDVSAYTLLHEADPNFGRRFRHVDRLLCKLLKDVQEHFPDACYYTASGGFHLMIGSTHSPGEIPNQDRPNQELDALSGSARIQDGDF